MIRLSTGRIFNRLSIQRPTVLFISMQEAGYADPCDILTSHLEIDYETAKSVIHSKDLSKISDSYLIRNCKTCQEFKIDVSNSKYLGICLTLAPRTLMHRICLLQEMGVQDVSAVHVSRLPYDIKKKASQFKAAYCIPENQCIMENIFNSVGGSPRDISSLIKMNRREKVVDQYIACMTHFKTWNLGLSNFPNVMYTSIKCQSFRLIRDVVHYFTNELQFDKNFIEQHPYLFTASVDEIRELLKIFENIKIGEIDFPELVSRYPRILMCDPRNIMDVLKLCEEYNVTDSIASCYNVFGLKKEIIQKRLEIIMNTPSLSVWAHHPRLMYMVVNFKLVQDRIRDLKMLGCLHKANVHTITATKSYFRRYVRSAKNNNGHKKFLEHVINNVTGACDMKYVARHPYWKNASFIDVHDVLQYLKENFTVEDILKNIHIIFYSRSLISETLQRFYKEYTPETGYNYTRSQYLALCLYMLEKDNHFTGDAIWRGQAIHESDSNAPGVLLESRAENDDISNIMQPTKRYFAKEVKDTGE